MRFAVEDFVYFYKLVTGKELSVTYVNGTDSLDDNESYFILGRALAENNSLPFDGLYTDTGYKIQKGDKGVCIYGNTEYGTLNGVYALLKQLFGLEIYTDEVFAYDGTVFDYFAIENVTFNPSIDNVWAMDGAVSSNDTGSVNRNYQRRLGFINSWQVYNGYPHDFLDVVPYSSYGTAHPDWYYEATATDSGNKFVTLCLSSGGDDMAKVVAKYAYDTFVSQDAVGNVKNGFFFGPPDARGWCECSACATAKEKYGSYSGVYVAFMNKVAKIFDETYSLGRKVTFYMMAYNAVIDAPVYSDGLKFYSSDNVSLCVTFAPIEANFYRAFTDDTANGLYGKTNAYYLAQYKKWQQFGDVSFWRYSAQFDNYFVPYDAISNMQATYKAIAEFGVKNFADQGVSGTVGATNFNALKIYLKSKLAKDVNADADALIRNFCNAYYGSAGESMYNLLKAEQAWCKTLSETLTEDKGKDLTGCHIIGNSDLFNEKYWDDTPEKSGIFGTKITYDASMLKGWYASYITAGLNAVLSGSVYEKRVKAEGIALRYMAYAVYGDETYGNFEGIKSDAKTLGITRFAEGNAFTKTSAYTIDGNIDNLS